MRRRAKPSKAKVESKRPAAPNSRETDSSRVRDLEERLAEALKREAEALEQQTATAEILSVISGSPTDLQPVFRTIVRSAGRLCDAFDAVIYRRDGDTLHLVAHEGPIPTAPMQALIRGWTPGRAVLDGRTVHVADIQAEADEFPEGSEIARRVGNRTVLSMPLMRKDGLAIGAIMVRRTEARLFTDRQVALLQTFADQAVIAIENVRLFNETKEALEQQTATSEILRVISSSPTDVRPVFDAIASSGLRLCGGEYGCVYRFDGELIHFVAHHGFTHEQLAHWRSTWPRPVTTGGVNPQAIRARRVVRIADVEADSDIEFTPETRANLRTRGVRSILSVPMFREGHVIGSISLAHRLVDAFPSAHVELLQTFADQAVIAIENVRLFTELQEKNRALTEAHAQVTEALDQQTATSEILKTISRSTFDLQPVLDTLLENAARLCASRRGVIMRREGDSYHGAAYYNVSSELIDFIERHPIMPGRHSVTARAALERRTIHVVDLQADPEYRYAMRDTDLIGTELGVPMFRGDEIVGVIILHKLEVQPFSDKQIELVESFADQAVIAIENVRLFSELEARNRELATALEKQTATAEILRVISRSPTDLQPVFDELVLNARRLLRGYTASLLRLIGDELHLAASNSTTQEGNEALRTFYPVRLGHVPLLQQAIRDREPLMLPDIETDPRVTEGTREVSRVRGYRSMLSVPLTRSGQVIGVIGITRQQSGRFASEEIDLLRTFADQAVIAIENVRLFRELEARNRDLSETLAQQTATAEVLKLISRSTFDLEPVLQTLIENAGRLCLADGGCIYKQDGEVQRLAAGYNLSPELRDFVERHPITPGRGTAVGRAMLERCVVHIPDVRDDPNYTYSGVGLGGYRTIIGVPMMREGVPIGVFAVWRTDVLPFTDKQIELVTTFADQGAIAIENMRLLSELQARTDELTRSVGELRVLSEVSQALSSTLDVDVVLDTIVTRANDLIGADGCTIFEYDEVTQQFHLRTTRNLEPRLVELARGTPLRKGDQGILGQLPMGRQAVQVADITRGSYSSPISDALIEAGYRAVVAVPLIREDHLIGALTMNRKTPGEFPQETIDLLQTFATQSALAIQNARLFREIEQKSRELEAASRHKSEFLANMSHELRTPLNAVIGFSEVLSERMFGELNEKQDEYLKDIHASGQHLLSLINDILDLSKIEAGKMELELSAFDLPMTIDNALMLVRERAARKGIGLHRSVDERLGQVRADERKIRQVLLNLLSNAIKFTPDGGRIEVRAKPVNGYIEVSVSDTGVGIAPEDQEAVFEEFKQVGTAEKKVEGTGLGLALSRKFIELHGGKIWAKSQAGAGSTFTFTVPVRRGE